jgi:hypothetical protein
MTDLGVSIPLILNQSIIGQFSDTSRLLRINTTWLVFQKLHYCSACPNSIFIWDLLVNLEVLDLSSNQI